MVYLSCCMRLTVGDLDAKIDVICNVQVPTIYWWYKTCSHAAELTAGYCNPTNQDGYSPLFEVLKKHSVTMKFMCSGLPILSHENDEALADPEGQSWQVCILSSSCQHELRKTVSVVTFVCVSPGSECGVGSGTNSRRGECTLMLRPRRVYAGD